MKALLRWGLAMLMVLAMVLVFAGGCAPAEEIDGGDDPGFEDWDDYIDDLDLDFDEGVEDGDADLEDGADFEDEEEAEDDVDVE